ncbi:unnamed protein product [Cochlearia groenlandica]
MGTFSELVAEVEHRKDSRVDMVVEDGNPTKVMDMVDKNDDLEFGISEEELIDHVEEVEDKLAKRKKTYKEETFAKETRNKKDNLVTDEWLNNDELTESEESEVEEDYNWDEMHELVSNDMPQIQDDVDEDDDFVEPPQARGTTIEIAIKKEKIWGQY